MKYIICILALLMLWSCSTNKTISNSSKPIVGVQKTAPQIIYKTKQDFSQNVPISMNKERTKITGFPAPSDIIINGVLQTPIQLEDGYFYDRRGISNNTVFIKLTYQAYSKLAKNPSIPQLMDLIIEKHPITEVYSCPNLPQASNLNTLNELVKSGFKDCQKIK